MTHPTSQELRDLLAGSLEIQFAEKLRRHLNDCQACETTLRELQATGGSATANHPINQATLGQTQAMPGGMQTAVHQPEDFGEYEILEELARGGMGVVYRARHKKLNRIVALKMILSGALATRDDVQRFHAEAEAAANLDHPNIVPVYEVGENAGQHYFAMGFVNGPSLADKIGESVLPPQEAASVVKIISEAIAYAHDRGIIHRDLKPANVLLAMDEQSANDPQNSTLKPAGSSVSRRKKQPLQANLEYVPKVTDFGLSKRLDEDNGMTATGQVLGTPAYMPPEQATGRIAEVTETADVYSLGAILYCTLIGRPPFQAANLIETLRQVAEQEPNPPRKINPAIPIDLETICLKCLEKEPSRRYASATELAEELANFLDGRPIKARPVGAAVQAARWTRRNPVVASLLAIVFLTLLSGIAATSYFAIQASQEAGVANLNLQTATREKADAIKAREQAVAMQKRLAAEKQAAETARAMAVKAKDQTQKAKDAADKARQAAEAARLVAVEGKKQEEAARKRAETAEQKARDASRELWRALARTRIALAKAHYRQENQAAMQAELSKVSKFHREGGDWRYLNNRADSATFTLPRTQSASLRFSVAIPKSNGRFVVSGQDGAFILNGRTGKLEGSLPADAESKPHNLYPNAVTADGKIFVGINRSSFKTEVYDLKTRKLIHEYSLRGRPPIAFDRQNNLYASQSDGTEKIDWRTGKVLAKRAGFWLLAIAQPTGLLIGSADNQLVAIKSLDGPVVWTAENVATRASLRAACSPDGKFVTVLHEGSTMRTFRADEDGPPKRNSLYSCDAPSGQFSNVYYNPLGNTFVSVGIEQDSAPVRVWDRQTGLQTYSLLGLPQSAQEPAFDLESRILVVPYGRGVKIWHLGFETTDQLLPGGVDSFGFAGAENLWRKSSDQGRVVLGNLDINMQPDFSSQKPCKRVVVSDDGSVAFLRQSNGSFLIVKRQQDTYKEINVPYFRVMNSMAISPGGKYCAAFEYKGRVNVFESTSGRVIFEKRVGGAGKYIAGNLVRFLSDSRLVACRSLGAIYATEIATFSPRGKEPRKKRLDYSVRSLAPSPDGKWIAVGCGDSRVRILNAATLEEKASFLAHDREVTAVEFHPLLPVLATASADHVVRLWEWENANQLGEFIGLGAAVTTLDFHPAGDRLGGAGRDLHLWDIKPYLATLTQEQ